MASYQDSDPPISGDINVNPNVGQPNKEVDSSLALDDLKFKLRVVNMVTCTVALVLLIPSFLTQLTSLRPARGILSLYLGLFSCLICCFELRSARFDTWIADSFGVVYNPIGRISLLSMMGGMAVGQGGLHIILGVVFFINALWTLFLYVKYPEYRNWTRPGEEEDILAKAQNTAKSYAWANPDHLVGSGPTEGQSLMRPEWLK
mmetsp:Transcript_21914/g.50568  ORF Transcript_21914/g.50568 Transcript_21914/m.50568 type:complete len:204 (-) Transcript_21914:243-854(-)